MRQHTPPSNIEVTLLALGRGYGLYGDRNGNVGRLCDNCITAVKTLAPVRIYIDNPNTEIIGGLPFVFPESVPEDKFFTFDRYKDPELGIGVYAAFDRGTRTWYVREVLDGIKPTGRFFFTLPELPVINFEGVVC